MPENVGLRIKQLRGEGVPKKNPTKARLSLIGPLFRCTRTTDIIWTHCLCLAGAVPTLEPILHCNVNRATEFDPMIKTTKTLAEVERITGSALRKGGATVKGIATAPASNRTSRGNWTLLHINSERGFDPMFRKLIRPMQARYDERGERKRTYPPRGPTPAQQRC